MAESSGYRTKMRGRVYVSFCMVVRHPLGSPKPLENRGLPKGHWTRCAIMSTSVYVDRENFSFFLLANVFMCFPFFFGGGFLAHFKFLNQLFLLIFIFSRSLFIVYVLCLFVFFS